MSGGVHYEDLLPVPETQNPFTGHERVEAHSMGEKPTLSHALAQANQHEEKGLVEMSGDGPEVKDLGWNEPPDHVPSPLVAGLPNEELWMYIRRFNKQVYHVKEYPYAVPGGLDLNRAEEDEFSPDKLRATLERLYMTVIIGLIGCYKHIARLRSWREAQRTAWFCTVYFGAWFLDFLVPTSAVTIITLLVYPPSRELLFPPAPIALVSGSGGVQKPKAGVLGSHDSATGAPENRKGEAVEQEASHFVNSIAQIVVSSAAGKHPMNDPPAKEGSAADAVPDPTAMISNAQAAREKASGNNPQADKAKVPMRADGVTDVSTEKANQTKVPMEAAMWSKMRPFMHIVGDIADGWERFANALSPTPPFPRDTARIRLALLIAPMLLSGLFVTSYMFMKGVTFGAGFGFFGDPIITRGLIWLNRNYPNWKKWLELKNTVLKGVPTNAQLTLTLLRIGEAKKAPLPPPPRSRQPAPDRPAALMENELSATGADASLGASQEEIRDAIKHDPNVAHQTAGSDIDASKEHKHGKKGSKILNFFKSTTRVTVEAALGADRLKAKVGDEHAKNRLGAIADEDEDPTSGPVDFKCRYHGKKGHVYISSKEPIPSVSFTRDSTVEKTGSADREDLHPIWSIAVADIKELKKVGGLGWKTKMVVGWALDKEVNDGLEIVDKRGNTWEITACPLRDELFNRLIAINGQKWESW